MSHSSSSTLARSIPTSKPPQDVTVEDVLLNIATKCYISVSQMFCSTSLSIKSSHIKGFELNWVALSCCMFLELPILMWWWCDIVTGQVEVGEPTVLWLIHHVCMFIPPPGESIHKRETFVELLCNCWNLRHFPNVTSAIVMKYDAAAAPHWQMNCQSACVAQTLIWWWWWRWWHWQMNCQNAFVTQRWDHKSQSVSSLTQSLILCRRSSHYGEQ